MTVEHPPRLNHLEIDLLQIYKLSMNEPWQLSDKQWRQISKSVPDVASSIKDRACLEALLYRTYAEGNVRDVKRKKQKDRYDLPYNSKFYYRLKKWKEDDLLLRIAAAYVETLGQRKRDAFRDALLKTKAQWRGEFLCVMKPPKLK